MKKSLRIAALLAAPSIFLSGCAAAESEIAEVSVPQIVTTTNVWADVASQVAGDKFEVIALISNVAQDPHSYEATARDQLAVSEAALFVMNGGGYDDFALQLASAAGVDPFNVYEIHEASHGDEHAHEGEAEHSDEHSHEGEAEHSDEHAHAHDGSDHIWYDLHIAELFATELAKKLGEIDSENAQFFLDNAKVFGESIEALEARVDAVSVSKLHYFEGHPMAGLLFADLGFENLTPKGFAEAEEAEVEPSAAVLSEARELLTSGEVNFMAVNEQVTSPTLDSLKELALEQGIPVLTFDELLPDGKNYQTWFSELLSELENLI